MLIFTLFPDKLLPVKSSLLMLKENPSGRFELFHGWIGVFRCARYIRTENNLFLCLENGFSQR